MLGPLRTWRDESELVFGSLQQRTVLGVLLLQANRPLSRERLIDAIWGEDQPTYALNLLQKHISGLRRVLEPERSPRSPSELLSWTDTGYLLTVPPGRLDLHVFETEVERARAARLAGDLRSAAKALHDALRLWRGPVCEGLASPLLDAERDRIGERQIDVVEERIDVELALGDHLELVSELRALVADHPLRERLRVLLMLALYRSGRQAEALSAFHEAREHLMDELGVEPGPALRRVHGQILVADPALTGAAPQPVQTVRRLPVPAQLPYGLAHFAGRHAELDRLDALCLDERAGGRAVVINAIGGMAGVGKTTLAVHWAHRVRDRFPDGQLYVNLRGFDPGGSAMEPAEAIRGFLDAFAVPPQRVPISVEGQAALYRSLLADQRVLIILDNARNAEQVRPLLPGTPTCLVLVTSRDQLSGLVVAEGAQPMTVDLLSAAEARQLLAQRLGEERVRAEEEAVGEIVTLCARLPLALAIVAARAATNPRFPLALLAGELREAKGGLDAFRTADQSTDIRSVFSWSLRRLSDPAQRLFILLGLHPGPDTGTYAAASLADTPLLETGSAMAELAAAHLLTEHAPGRFVLHDLLRAYSSELARATRTGAELRAATSRMLDHYLQSAFLADRLINPLRDPLLLAPPGQGVTPISITAHDQAMEWFAAEHAVLLAAVEQAHDEGYDLHGWQLAWTLSTYLDRRGHWQDLAATHRTALASALRSGDPAAQALAHRGIARAYARLDRYEEAHRHLLSALALFEEAGDQAGQAYAHRSLASLLEPQGRDLEALDHAQRALDLYRRVDHKAGLADALNAVGWFHARVGDHRQGLACCREALALHEELDDEGGQAETWDSLGYAYHHLGDHEQAVACYHRALDLYRKIGDRYNEAATLSHLGDTHHATGRGEAAERVWRSALTILTEIGHGEAEQIAGRLSGRTDLAHHA
ncbi:AfsR/SARP family transcriptional regulator [Nonomuraea solani]|uniref:AfsR/SARP family transcriptional regulator n=1 Tax=Nonomuraea solani TaxID=1144553 RepID=UPI001359C156|nr:BTAD domain-containing putative transcriptional regulator [Nonomuraea solani]